MENLVWSSFWLFSFLMVSRQMAFWWTMLISLAPEAGDSLLGMFLIFFIIFFF